MYGNIDLQNVGTQEDRMEEDADLKFNGPGRERLARHLDDITVQWRIGLLSRTIDNEQLSAARQSGLNVNTLHVLLLLITSGPMRPSDLADHLFITKAAMTGCLDRLSERGLLTRGPAENDRREQVVMLTTEGEEEAKRLFDSCALGLTLNEALREMPEAERKILDNALKGLLDRVRSKSGGRPCIYGQPI